MAGNQEQIPSLRASREQLFDALQPEELSGPHVFVLKEIMAHIEELEVRMGRFEQALIQGLDAWRPQLILLQTIPGIDLMGAAMLLVEIGTDMSSFGCAEKLASWVGNLSGQQRKRRQTHERENPHFGVRPVVSVSRNIWRMAMSAVKGVPIIRLAAS